MNYNRVLTLNRKNLKYFKGYMANFYNRSKARPTFYQSIVLI